MIHCEVIGKLVGKEPELRLGKQGGQWCFFCIEVSCSRGLGHKLEDNVRVFVDVNAFGGVAKYAVDTLRLHDVIMVTGHLQIVSFTEEKTGRIQQKLRVRAEYIQTMDRLRYGNRGAPDEREVAREREDTTSAIVPDKLKTFRTL